MKRLLILIPAFNEEKSLPRVVTDVRRTMPDADLLVVNDGSRDATASVARELGVAVLSHPWNMGYGVALQTGYKYAHAQGYDLLVQIDGDGQHDPSSMADLLEPVVKDEADFVIGSRFHSSSTYRPSLARKLGMLLFRKLVSALVGQRLTDTTSGFQACNARVISYLTRDSFPCDYPDADLLILLHRAGFRIAERSVRMFADNGGQSMHSGLKPLYYVFKMFLSIGVTLLRSDRYR
ncbi:MAG: glycosyl transferase family 2 [Desulfuromonas sp.]|nr:MAG: glycosyl transferase family 2 [Desulfuromonas sp.]